MLSPEGRAFRAKSMRPLRLHAHMSPREVRPPVQARTVGICNEWYIEVGARMRRLYAVVSYTRLCNAYHKRMFGICTCCSWFQSTVPARRRALTSSRTFHAAPSKVQVKVFVPLCRSHPMHPQCSFIRSMRLFRPLFAVPARHEFRGTVCLLHTVPCSVAPTNNAFTQQRPASNGVQR